MSSPLLSAEWVVAYEQECGKRPSDLAVRIVQHIEKVGDKLRELGRKETQQGEPAYPADVFPALAVKVFRLVVTDDPETVQAIADLWQSDYLEGRQEGGAL